MITPLCFAAVIGCKYAKKGASAAWKKTEEFSVKFYDAVNDKLYAKEQHAKLLEEQEKKSPGESGAERSEDYSEESYEDYSEESSEDYEPDELDD